ncbi:MAG: L,D-transpeptidase family protein [Candidatus Kerfeldbacteria bacterium]|nr:L,D-transpeptidase family protein [Candidatus Kerfeldbacteria bacterium]
MLLPGVAQAANERLPEIRIFHPNTLAQERSFFAFDGKFKGGASIAVGDVGTDGIPEIVVGAGPNGGPTIAIYRKDGSLIKSFYAYDRTMKTGVNVAVGDLNGDGRGEIITSPETGRAHIRVFNSRGEEQFTPGGFMAYSNDHIGGAHVAAADIDGDGKDEIVTSAGYNSSGHVRGFNKWGTYIGFDIFPFASSHRGGAVVARANVDGGPEDELVIGVRALGQSFVKVYKTNAAKTILFETRAFTPTFTGGVNVAGGDIDNDGKDEIFVAASKGGGPHIQMYETNGDEITRDLFAYESDYRGGVSLALGDVDNDGRVEIVTAPTRREPDVEKNKKAMVARGGVIESDSLAEFGKVIEVDISEQRLYVFENGKQVYTSLVSTGIKKYPTPIGVFSVTAKIPLKDYEWSYGPNHPDNYDIKDVANNLRFAPSFYLHYAYWHNDFGRRRSHGCVNLDLKTSEWIYAWAPTGTRVLIHE